MWKSPADTARFRVHCIHPNVQNARFYSVSLAQQCLQRELDVICRCAKLAKCVHNTSARSASRRQASVEWRKNIQSTAAHLRSLRVQAGSRICTQPMRALRRCVQCHHVYPRTDERSTCTERAWACELTLFTLRLYILKKDCESEHYLHTLRLAKPTTLTSARCCLQIRQ